VLVVAPEGKGTMVELINKHLNDYNTSNWTEWKAALAPDVTYEEVPTRVKVKGPDEYMKATQRWKKAFPDSTGTMLDAIESEDGSEIATEIEWKGTHTAALEGPMGTIPPTNKKVTVKATMMLRVRNGKIVDVRHFFDLLTILAQIGVAPMAGMQSQAGAAGVAHAAPRRP
jgi:steroid delta-isomerase-like uncharacterized protein